jgi:hypothetical protein
MKAESVNRKLMLEQNEIAEHSTIRKGSNMVSLQSNQLHPHLRRNPLPTNNFIHHITPKNKGKTTTAGFSRRVV